MREVVDLFDRVHLIYFLSITLVVVFIKFSLFSYDVLRPERKIQCFSLIDFRCQVKWQPEMLSFNEFTVILSSIPNLEYFSCTLVTEINKEKLNNSDYVNIEKWKNLCMEFHNLIHLDCSITCPSKSSTCSHTDFVKIIANISRASDRTINIQLYHNNETNNIDKNDVSISILSYIRLFSFCRNSQLWNLTFKNYIK